MLTVHRHSQAKVWGTFLLPSESASHESGEFE